MKSNIYTKKNIFFGSYDIQYHAELPLPEKKEDLQKFSWKLLHSVLPREIRTGGTVTNLKGIKNNNILLANWEMQIPENEDLLYDLRGINPQEDGSNLNDDQTDDTFYYSIKSEFSDFPDKKNIRYKSNIFHDGNITDFTGSPVFAYDGDLEINSLFLGLEFFEPNFFAYIGFAPRIKHSLAIKTNRNSLLIRLRSEDIKIPADFFNRFSETGKNLIFTIDETCNLNIEENYTKLISQKLPGTT